MSAIAKLIYLDVCALGRPFDEQSQSRIRIESEAVHLILQKVLVGELILSTSPTLHIEISANPSVRKRQLLEQFLVEHGVEVLATSEQVHIRADEFVHAGVGISDALHVALAESSGAEFISCDDRLLSRLARVSSTVWCGTSAQFCRKEGLT